MKRYPPFFENASAAKRLHISKNRPERKKSMYLLDPNKSFYKANLHCHSTKSDGRATLDEIKAAYQKRGYSVVAFTDHDALYVNSHLTDENFVAITSTELAIKEDASTSTLVSHRMKCAHLNFYALDEKNDITPCYSSAYDKKKLPEVRYEGEYQRVYSPKCVNEMIKTGHEKGFLVSLNHPSWSLQDSSDYLAYEGLDFLEIYNTGCVRAGHADDESVLDIMALNGKKVFCTAADDNHNGAGFEGPESDSFGGFVMINSEKLEYNSVMTALKNGNFYASSGPNIYSLEREGNTVKISCSRAERVFLATDSRLRRHLAAPVGEAVTEASFELPEGVYFLFRLIVEDASGKKAYTQFYDRYPLT